MIYIVIAYFFILLLITITRKYWVPVVFLVALYTFSLAFSALMLETTSDYHVDLISSLIFVVATTLLFSTFFIEKPEIVPCYKTKFVQIFNLTGYIISSIIILSTIILLPYIKLVFIIGLADARHAAVEGESVVVFATRSIPAYSYRILSMLYPLSYSLLLMFFYSLCFYKNNKLQLLLFFLGSFAGVIIGIFNGGRTNVMYWIMALVLMIIIFYPYLSAPKKMGLSIIAGAFLSVIVIYFLLVSEARFGDVGTESSLLTYTGSPFLNYCDFIQNYHANHFSLRRILPFLSETFGGHMSITEYRDIIYKKSHMDIGLFYTLLGDLYVDLGLIGSFIYIAIYRKFAKKALTHRQYSFSHLLIFLVVVLIPLQGIFYYSYWRSVVTICSIVIIVYAKYLQKYFHA